MRPAKLAGTDYSLHAKAETVRALANRLVSDRVNDDRFNLDSSDRRQWTKGTMCLIERNTNEQRVVEFTASMAKRNMRALFN